MAAALLPWYEQLGEELRASAWLNADETGWRVNGQTPLALVASAIRWLLLLIDPLTRL